MDDFVSRSGGFSIGEFGARQIAPFYSNHWFAITLAIVILTVLVIAFFFGLIGKKKVPEKMSVLTRVVRDGPGESLAQGALETGFAADPSTFCASAGEPTNDPFDYLRQTVTESTEGFAPYPGYQTQMDSALASAMQH